MDRQKTNYYITLEELEKVKENLSFKRDQTINKRNTYIKSLKKLSIQEILEKFSYINMQQDNPDFCPLYAKNKTCHEIDPAKLNCYGCLCPNYQLEISTDQETGIYKLGLCAINSQDGIYKLTDNKLDPRKHFYILNCLNCKTPHNDKNVRLYIEKYLNTI